MEKIQILAHLRDYHSSGQDRLIIFVIEEIDKDIHSQSNFSAVCQRIMNEGIKRIYDDYTVFYPPFSIIKIIMETKVI